MSDLDAQAKANLLFELDAKIGQFQSALKDLLGLEMIPFRTNETSVQSGGFRGNTADESPRSVSPGETLRVRVHATQATTATRLEKVWLDSEVGSPHAGGAWKSSLSTGSVDPTALTADPIFQVQVPSDAEPTTPFFTRPSIKQPYYDISNPAWRERSFAPYPLAAWAEFSFDGLPIRIGKVVQTLQRVTGPGGIYEPLDITPAIGIRVEPEARILPLNGSALPVHVTVHAQAATEGIVDLKLPAGWSSDPANAPFHLKSGGDTDPILSPSPRLP